MIEASRQLTIGSPVYNAAHAITLAIDSLATLLTGDNEYFWEKGGGAPEAQRAKMADRAAQERGEKPWQS